MVTTGLRSVSLSLACSKHTHTMPTDSRLRSRYRQRLWQKRALSSSWLKLLPRFLKSLSKCQFLPPCKEPTRSLNHLGVACSCRPHRRVCAFRNQPFVALTAHVSGHPSWPACITGYTRVLRTFGNDFDETRPQYLVKRQRRSSDTLSENMNGRPRIE
jgi:hypothetical protein